MSEEIRIYVACLASYNNGMSHGVWIDATKEVDDIYSDIREMLKNSPMTDAEEYAIHDYEGFAGYSLSEYEGIEQANQIACFIEKHGALGAELLSYGDIDAAKKMLEENYHGCFESLADYAQGLTEDTTEIPEHLAFYIDYEKMGRDMEMSGDVFIVEMTHDEVHIFVG